MKTDHKVWLAGIVPVLMLWSPAAFAADPEDPLSSPTEHAVHFTPEMGRSLGRIMTQRLFSRYQLPEDKYEESAEIIAGHLSEWMAEFDDPENRDRAEAMFAEMLQVVADFSDPDRAPNFMPRIASALARHGGHTLAPLQERLNRIGRDIRPMLPLKQQLRLAADMTTFGAGFDAFEERIETWNDDDMNAMENPFEPESSRVRLNDEGVSRSLEAAQRRAKRMADYGPDARWTRYVKNAISYYDLDESQQASAESLLREYRQRAKALRENESLQQRKTRLLTWRSFWGPMARGRDDTLSYLISSELERIDAAMRAMDIEFKRRVDEIPTSGQQAIAEQRAWEILAAKGVTRETLDETIVSDTQTAGDVAESVTDQAEVQP